MARPTFPLNIMLAFPVLTSGDNAAAVTSVNASLIPELCGANFLPAADAGEALPPQPPQKIQMIAGRNDAWSFSFE